MDVRMPICDGVAATRELCQRYPWMRILVLTTFDDDEYVWQCLSAGALGYLLKKTPSQQIAAAIRSVFQGYSQLGPTIAPKVFSQIKPSTQQKSDASNLLSKREIEVLKLVGQGNNNREIARSLHLSEGTVKNYVTQILSKLDARDRISAVLWAQKNLL
jgi:DNA-binding NarL/FixJ family response regulator